MAKEHHINISNGVINGYVAFSIEQAKALIAQGKTPFIIVDSEEICNAISSLEREPKKVAFSMNVGSEPHHDLIFLESSWNCHCLPYSQLEDYSFTTANNPKAVEGTFGGIKASLQDGDPISIEYKKYIINRHSSGEHSSIINNNIIHPHHCQEREVNTQSNSIELFMKDIQQPMQIAANASDPLDLQILQQNNIHKIGLYRTEKMMKDTRSKGMISPNIIGIKTLKNLYLAKNADELQKPLKQFYDMQHLHFCELFKNIKSNDSDFDINIRLLDYPADEIPAKELLENFQATHGGMKRGTMLAQDIPELYETQIQAILDAAKAVELPETISLGIMLPNVEGTPETQKYKTIIEEKRNQTLPNRNVRFGVMVENQAAINNASSLAPLCDFMSFGTNDLSAEILSYDRNLRDKSVANIHRERGYDPRNYLAPEVEAQLSKAIKVIKAANPNTHIALCGDQASQSVGMANTIDFVLSEGIDSLSLQASSEPIQTAKLLCHITSQQQSQSVVAKTSFADRNPKRNPLAPDGSGREH